MGRPRTFAGLGGRPVAYPRCRRGRFLVRFACLLMLLIALRPEYQLSVDQARNRVFYQNFEAMQFARALPHYLLDWAAALARVRPGFRILSDMQIVNQANPALQARFQAVERLIVAHGVCLVAEVSVPGVPTRRHCDEVTTEQAMPVRQFLSVWEALQFLDERREAA